NPELSEVFSVISREFSGIEENEVEIGSTIYAVKPGDGSAREQAASCQRVLGGLANIASEYATKRYRSNLINWGMLPFLLDGSEPFEKGDYIFIPEIKKAVADKMENIKAYVVKKDGLQEFSLKLGSLTEDERTIIRKGCLINYYKG
ncbi:MAG: hydratase, partial [Acetivibrio ethanolgignens]